MKREIKFRVWDGERYLDQDIAISSKGRVIDIEECMWNYESENSVVQQYTGLKDRNGIEIYEGDIVSMYDPIHKEETYVEGVVTYEAPEYVIRKNDLDYALYHSSNILEIKGNIHENGDLLK